MMYPRLHKIGCLLFLVLFACSCSKYKTYTGAPVFDRPYLTWQGDPSTTIVITYQSASLPEGVEVVYDERSEPPSYRYRATGASHQISELPDGRYINSVALENLEPGRSYYFRFGDRQQGYSSEYSFRTVPRDAAPIRFVSGGDTRITRITRDLFLRAAEQDPLFVVIGGDLAYADGDPEKIGRWDAWFQHWHDYMVAPGGRLIPMVLGIGNHEVNKNSGDWMTRAPFFFGFFPQGGKPFFSRQFGAHLGMVVLDSGHLVEYELQADWLSGELDSYATLPFRVAVYHVPLYPSYRAYDDPASVAGRTFWLPIFESRRLNIGFEHHDHTFKRTKPLLHNEVNPQGIYYVGDGNMGVRPRRPKNRLWYMEKVAKTSHFWIVDVDGKNMNLRAMDSKGKVFDEFTVAAK